MENGMKIEIEGLKILVEDDDELQEAVSRLQNILDVDKPYATKFLRCWAEARGSEIAGRDMRLLDKAKFYPDQTLEELREKARDAFVRMSFVNETFGGDRLDLKRVDEELEDWMAHCFESSEGVLWIN